MKCILCGKEYPEHYGCDNCHDGSDLDLVFLKIPPKVSIHRTNEGWEVKDKRGPATFTWDGPALFVVIEKSGVLDS